jgi:apolipoprotein N-acyltransferase
MAGRWGTALVVVAAAVLVVLALVNTRQVSDAHALPSIRFVPIYTYQYAEHRLNLQQTEDEQMSTYI